MAPPTNTHTTIDIHNLKSMPIVAKIVCCVQPLRYLSNGKSGGRRCMAMQLPRMRAYTGTFMTLATLNAVLHELDAGSSPSKNPAAVGNSNESALRAASILAGARERGMARTRRVCAAQLENRVAARPQDRTSQDGGHQHHVRHSHRKEDQVYVGDQVLGVLRTRPSE